MHCANSSFPGLDSESVFPGLDTDGGMAEYLLPRARACVKLDPDTEPKDVAALADAGITAYHAVRKAIPQLYPGTTCAVIGAGGLGHIGIQCLAALTATNIIVVDRHPDALKLAEKLGAHHTVVADGGQVDAVQKLTNGGADVVLDFVAEEGAENEGFAMTRPNGSYFVIGYGGTLVVPTLDVISTERNIIGNIVGTYNDLAELMVLAQTGKSDPAHQDLPARRTPWKPSRSSTPAGFGVGPSSFPDAHVDDPVVDRPSLTLEDRWPKNCVLPRTPGVCCWQAWISWPRP